MIPDQFIQELRYRNDLESVMSSYIELKRRGRNLVGLCPFHSEKTPSLTVYPENQSFYCFGCGAGGDVITFIRKMENLDYIEALRFLAARVGMELPDEGVDDSAARLRTRILEINRETARFYHSALMSDMGREALQYLTDRGLTPKTIRRFGLGYAPNAWDAVISHLRTKGYTIEEMTAASVVNKGRTGRYYDQFRDRAVFPIIDLRGSVIGFGARLLHGEGPKYINSPDTPVFKKSRNLFALNFAKAAKADSLILAEGYMDVISIHQAGFSNAVATLGTALTPDQSRLMKQYADQVIIAYDSDGAGQAATRRAINLFDQAGVRVKVLKVTGAKDPDEFLKKYGPARFKVLLEGSSGAMEYELERIRSRYDTDTPEGKVGMLKDCVQLLAGLHNALEREVYAAKLSQELNVSKDAILMQINTAVKRRVKDQQNRQNRDLKIYTQAGGHRYNPEEDRDIQATVAENKLLTILMKSPDYAPDISRQLTAEDFPTALGRSCYQALMDRLLHGRPADLSSLSQDLPEEGISKLSALLASSAGIRFSREDADFYIRHLLERRERRSPQEAAQLEYDQYAAYLKKLAEEKKKHPGGRL